MKKNNLSVMLGRFQHFHLGHKVITDLARSESQSLLILIGSAEHSDTLRNPFCFKTRGTIINGVYEHDRQVYVAPIEDLTNENDITHEWGEFVLGKIEYWRNIFNLPKFDAMYYGNDELRERWFHPKSIVGVDMIAIKRGKEIDISATELRQMIAFNNKEEWMKYTHESTHEYFDQLRKELLNIPYYKELSLL